MAKLGHFMYNYVVDIGDTPASPSEKALLRLQIQLAVSRRFQIDRNWRYDLQSPFWRLYVINRRGAFITHSGRRLLLKPNRLYLIPSWVRFQSGATRILLQDYLHFYVTGLPPTLLRRFFDRPLLLERDAVLERLRVRWQDGFRSNLAFGRLAWATALAYAAVATATSKLSPAAQQACFRSFMEFSPISPALECMDQRFAQPPANPELARLCHLSTDRFIRQFHRIVGMTPAQYGLERRIAVGAQWLTATSRTLEEIADASGFTDRFHFSRVFKARLGLPPVAYRRLHRMAIDEKAMSTTASRPKS
ncbi:MAG TPA: AraC family transcriptional regulator [Candidatus Methylacidiphilales bacterium]